MKSSNVTILVVTAIVVALGIKSIYFKDKRVRSSHAEAPKQIISYEKHVKPIFAKNCSACHNADSGLPNWLDYQTAYDNRQKIQDKVLDKGQMPPQNANGFGLTRHELAVLKVWLDQGANK